MAILDLIATQNQRNFKSPTQIMQEQAALEAQRLQNAASGINNESLGDRNAAALRLAQLQGDTTAIGNETLGAMNNEQLAARQLANQTAAINNETLGGRNSAALQLAQLQGQGAAIDNQTRGARNELALATGQSNLAQQSGATELASNLAKNIQRAPEADRPRLYQQARELVAKDFPNANLAGIPEEYDPQFTQTLAGLTPDNRGSGQSTPASIQELNEIRRLRDAGLNDEADMLARKANFISRDSTELSSKETDRLIKVNTAAQQSVASAARQRSLADRFLEAEGQISSGVLSNIDEFFKRTTGTQDEYTQLRNEWQGESLKQVLANLPIGPASDKDVALASRPLLPPSAGPKAIAEQLQAMARVQDHIARYNKFEANYISTNKSLSDLSKDFVDYARQVKNLPEGIPAPQFNKYSKVPPKAAINKLRANPDLAPAFEEMYGAIPEGY